LCSIALSFGSVVKHTTTFYRERGTEDYKKIS
jgi:hypothetical protein